MTWVQFARYIVDEQGIQLLFVLGMFAISFSRESHVR